MADINSKLEIGVTTGPIRGSRKVHVGALQVAMREIDLEPSSGEPPLRVYDTSGPYTDLEATIDIRACLQPCAANGISRAATSRNTPRARFGPRTNGHPGGPDPLGECRRSRPRCAVRCAPRPLATSPRCTTRAPADHHAGDGIRSRHRENLAWAADRASSRRPGLGLQYPRLRHSRFRPRRVARVPRQSFLQRHPPNRADGRSPPLPSSRSTPYRTPRSPAMSRRSRQDGLVDPLGADTVHDLSTGRTSTPPANGSSPLAGSHRTVPILPGARKVGGVAETSPGRSSATL